MEQRSRGLMYRSGILETQGMLFIFDSEDRHAIWMKNMKFSIDILWLDEQQRIVDILESVPPCRLDPCGSYKPQKPARYVLELSHGTVFKTQLKVGDRMTFRQAGA